MFWFNNKLANSSTYKSEVSKFKIWKSHTLSSVLSWNTLLIYALLHRSKLKIHFHVYIQCYSVDKGTEKEQAEVCQIPPSGRREEFKQACSKPSILSTSETLTWLLDSQGYGTPLGESYIVKTLCLMSKHTVIMFRSWN